MRLRYHELAVILNYIKGAQLHRRCSVVIPVSPSQMSLVLLACLQRHGVIAHFDCVTRTPVSRSGRAAMSLVLAYASHGPVARVQRIFQANRGWQPLTHRQVRQLVGVGVGQLLFLLTPRGWLSHVECLRYRLGGIPLFSVQVGA